MPSVEPPALELRNITAGYSDVPVLRDISLRIPAGSVVALLGSNGAGKTTLLRVIAGLMRPMSGRLLRSGNDITGEGPPGRSRSGICLIPEGRGVFPSLSVRENLQLQIPRWRPDKSIDVALEVFPALARRLGQAAGTMSGGQQQMLALSRAFLAEPALVALDEVSMGLAPIVVEQIFAALRRLADTGVAMLVVEQYVSQALEFATEAHVVRRGALVYSGPAQELNQDELLDSYLGQATAPAQEPHVSSGDASD